MPDELNKSTEPADSTASATATVRREMTFRALLEAWYAESDLVAQEIAFCQEFHFAGECEYCNDPDYKLA